MTECSYPKCEREAAQVFIDRVKDRNPYNRNVYKKRKNEFCDKHIKDRWILVWKIHKIAFITILLITFPFWISYYLYKKESNKSRDSYIWADVEKKPLDEVSSE